MVETRNKLLVVAAHPDDEVLGCGATVALRVASGWEAHLLIMATGIAGRFADVEKHAEEIGQRVAELDGHIGMVAKILGFCSHKRLDFPDNRLDVTPRQDLVHAILPLIEEIKPRLVLTHHPGDYNWDHGHVFDAVMMAARRSPGEVGPAEIMTFEVPSSTERGRRDPEAAFHPNVFINVEKTIDKKKLAMRHYESEYRDYPHPRSIEGIEYWARKRGLEVGLGYAEAFHLIRRVEE